MSHAAFKGNLRNELNDAKRNRPSSPTVRRVTAASKKRTPLSNCWLIPTHPAPSPSWQPLPVSWAAT